MYLSTKLSIYLYKETSDNANKQTLFIELLKINKLIFRTSLTELPLV